MHLQTKMASQSYFLVVLLITLLPSGIEHCTFQKAVVSSGFSPLIKVNVFSWLENSSRLHCSEEFCVGVVLVLVLFFKKNSAMSRSQGGQRSGSLLLQSKMLPCENMCSGSTSSSLTVVMCFLTAEISFPLGDGGNSSLSDFYV